MKISRNNWFYRKTRGIRLLWIMFWMGCFEEQYPPNKDKESH